MRDHVASLEAQLDWHHHKMPYVTYLLTAHWRHMRSIALEHYGRSCALCGAKDKIVNVHHRTYERLGSERLEDLTILCNGCHQTYHDKKAA
jgi:5-methylcytosine-specific restriction endonuclease McrA